MVEIIEIVSLALAVAALLVPLAERYHHFFQPFLRWKSYEKDLEQLRKFTELELTKFFNSFQRLIGASCETLTGVLNDSNGIFWDDPRLQASVAKMLGPSYIPLRDSVTEFTSSMYVLHRFLEEGQERNVGRCTPTFLYLILTLSRLSNCQKVVGKSD